MPKTFKLFGFEVNTKKFLIAIGAYALLVAILLLVHFFATPVSWYGFLIGSAFVLAVIVATALTKERELYKDFAYDIIWVIFPMAIIGARVFYVVNALDEFDSFIEMLKIWEGGLSIYGGIIFGAVGVFIFCAIKKINPLKALDVIAPVLILGQAIGRWGNFINQEVYGREITNSALQWFPIGVNVNGTWYMATFFYESVLNLIGFFVLVYLIRKVKQPGIVVFSYLFWYGIVRFALESLRVQQFVLLIPGTNIQFSSLVSIIFVVIGVAGLISVLCYNRYKKNKKVE